LSKKRQRGPVNNWGKGKQRGMRTLKTMGKGSLRGTRETKTGGWRVQGEIVCGKEERHCAGQVGGVTVDRVVGKNGGGKKN